MRATYCLSGLLLMLCVMSQVAYPHPGHEVLPLSSESIVHYAFEPVHFLPALFAGLVLAFVVRWIVFQHWRRTARK